jgi:hypothetical protein
VQTLETLVEKVSESFLNYLHLWTWLDQKMIHHLSGRPRKTFVSAKDFWNSVFQGEIHPGDRVKFKEAFVTEWLPKSPGRIWHEGLKNVRGRFSKNIDFLRRGNGFYSEGLLDSSNYDPLG